MREAHSDGSSKSVFIASCCYQTFPYKLKPLLMCWHCCPLLATGWCVHLGLCKFSIMCFQAKWRFWLQRWRGGFLLLWNRGEHGLTFGGAVQPHAHVTYYIRPGPHLPHLDLWCVSIWTRPRDPHPTQPISTVGAVPYPHRPRLPGNITLQCVYTSYSGHRFSFGCVSVQTVERSYHIMGLRSNEEVFMDTFQQCFYQCVWVCAFTLEISCSFKPPTQGSVLVINATH